MIAILTAALLSSTPAITAPESGFAGDLVATWVREDEKARLAISLDADGRCAVVGHAKPDGPVYRAMCGYWVLGPVVHLRMKSEQPGLRPEIELLFDRESGELNMSGQSFKRTPLTARVE